MKRRSFLKALNSYRNVSRNVRWVVALCFVLDSAYAIDPNRAISQYVREHWGIAEGFPRAPVYAITQTSDGYLWIGTEAGLVRFDGRNFRTVKDTSGKVSISSVRGLAPDRDGSLWIRLGDRGLVRYHDGIFENPTPDRESSRGVYVLDRNARGEILLAQMLDVIPGKAPGILVPVIFRNGRIPKDGSREPCIAFRCTGDCANAKRRFLDGLPRIGTLSLYRRQHDRSERRAAQSENQLSVCQWRPRSVAWH